jgi:MFS family permease
MQPYVRVWSVLLLGWMNLYMVRVGFSPALPSIMQEFQLTHSQAGLLATSVFLAYTFLQIPAGHLGDRYGRKSFLVLSTCGWSAASFLTGLANSFASLFCFRFLTGFFEGGYFGNDRPIIAACTPASKMGLGQGVSAMGMGLGMGFGMLLGGLISQLWGWRYVFILFAIPSLATAVLIWIFVRETPRAEKGASSPQYLRSVMKKELWLIYFAGFTVMYAFWVLGTWMPVVLKEQGVSRLFESSLYASLLGLIAIPALPVSGLWSDRAMRVGKGRKRILLPEILILSLLLVVMGHGLEARWGIPFLVALIVLAGFFLWAFFAPFYALIADTVPREVLGTTFGLSNTVSFCGSLIAPWASGAIRDSTGSFAWGFYASAILLVFGALSIGALRPALRRGPEAALRF